MTDKTWEQIATKAKDDIALWHVRSIAALG